MNHTPRPWHVVLPDNDRAYEIRTGAGPDPVHRETVNSVICSMESSVSPEETTANAILMAAALELLQELKEAYQTMTDWIPSAFVDEDMEAIFQRISEAIAKAKGEV